MRGKVAKRLRKEAYGEMSHRTRKYRQDGTGAIFCSGLRGVYLQLKKQYKFKK